MTEFDLFQVRIMGIGDDGFSGGEVRLGYWDSARQDREIYTIGTHFEAELGKSLADTRDQARQLAAKQLRRMANLPEQHTAEELHQLAQQNAAKASAAANEEAMAGVENALRGEEGEG